MAYLLSGLILSGALLLAMSGAIFWASILFFASVWLFNWPRKKWRSSGSSDLNGCGSGNEDGDSGD